MRKLGLEEIAAYARSKGFELLSKEYINSRKPLELRCAVHGVFLKSFSEFKRQKHGCTACANQNAANLQKLDLNEVKNAVIALGYKPAFDSYVNAKNPIAIECAIHGIFYARYDNLVQGKGCIKCGWASNASKNKLAFEEIQSRCVKKNIKFLIDKESYVLIKNTKTKLPFECSKHGIFESTVDTITYSNGCPSCSNHASNGELELLDFVKKYSKPISRDRSVLKTHEIDVIIPEKRIGIEYCGIYWHSEIYKTDTNYHRGKMKEANEKGYRLITIFEDEWIHRKPQVQGFLMSVLGVGQKIYARKCAVKEIDKEAAQRFTEEHHIQGKTSVRYAFGLFYNEELLGVISFDKHHRKNNSHEEIVLNRLCFKSGINIVGGSSKLLNHAIRVLNKEYSKIVSWSDNRWSEGNVYKQLGFEKEEELRQDYSYVKLGKDTRTAKQCMKKTNLTKMGGVGPTERDMAQSLGYYRIWDCGKIRWAMYI